MPETYQQAKICRAEGKAQCILSNLSSESCPTRAGRVSSPPEIILRFRAC